MYLRRHEMPSLAANQHPYQKIQPTATSRSVITLSRHEPSNPPLLLLWCEPWAMQAVDLVHHDEQLG
ncbi:hypothetical protein PG984_013307 [Apiospora sp. TS-2023a]